jgi:hypothetical protein
MEETLQEQPRLNFWKMISGTIISPSDTLAMIAQQRPWIAAVSLIVFLEGLGYVLGVLLPSRDYLSLGITSKSEFSLTGMFFEIAYALLRLAVFALLVHGIVRAWIDQGSYGGVFCALAFAWLPIILLHILGILGTPSNLPVLPWPSTLEGPKNIDVFMLSLAILIVIWTVTLGIMAIRGNYNIRVMAAVVTYFGAAIIQSIIFSWGRKVLELFTK